MSGEAMTARALALLDADAVFHMDMIEAIRRGTGDILDITADGVLLRETGSGALMMTATAPDTAARFLSRDEAAPLFVAHQPFYVAEAAARYGLHATMTCYQAAWTRGEAMSLPRTGLTYRMLEKTCLPRVAQLYSHDIGDDYLAGRIAAGELFGAFDGDALAGIIGLHEEGSMGMLEVDPAYRRRQVGTGLLAFLVNRLLEQESVPFSQFTEANEPSRRLHETLGFDISDKPLYWLE